MIALKSPIVLKIGGSFLESHEGLHAFCAALSSLHLLPEFQGRIVLCHGGGKEISRNLQWLGEEAHFKHGLRITSAGAMNIVEMTLSGSINKSLVRALQLHGTRACGISGVDGSTFICQPLDPELGQVGTVEKVNTHLVVTLLEAGFLPVISPVSVDVIQIPFNVNADDAASALATALKAEKLIFISDVPGVLDEHSRILSQLQRESIVDLISLETVSGGMIPKLHSCLQAVAAGVGEVHICGFENAETLVQQLQGINNLGTIILPSN